MPPLTPRGSFWPTRTQWLLLRTALAEPDVQLGAWHQLGPAFDLRSLEPGSISVLPLIYRNLSQILPNDPRLQHLKGVYRSAWVKNNLLAEQLAQALDAFESDGIETLLVGSLGAAVRYFPELGLRPTPALEFLIENDTLLPAWRALGRLGWSAPTSLMPRDDQPIVLANAQGQVCVLRTTAAVDLNLDYHALRGASVTVKIAKRTVRAPSAEHDLLAACAAGGRMKPVPSIQWIVDVGRIAQTVTAGVNWDSLLDLARDQAQTLRLHETIAYLVRSLELHLPPAAGRLLETPAVPARERIAYGCAGVSVTGLGSLPQAIAEHLVATRARPATEAIVTIPEFLRCRWELEHRWQLPLAGGRRVVARITGRARADRDPSPDRYPV